MLKSFFEFMALIFEKFFPFADPLLPSEADSMFRIARMKRASMLREKKAFSSIEKGLVGPGGENTLFTVPHAGSAAVQKTGLKRASSRCFCPP